MMVRRVLCLVLSVQLLLVQGLLSRTCTGACGRADRPHVHMSQLVPPKPATEARRGGCSCRRSRPTPAAGRDARPAVDARESSPEKGDHGGDAVDLPTDPLAASGGRGHPSADGDGVAFVAVVAAAGGFLSEAGPRQSGEPPPRTGRPPCPLYLLNLTLLI